MKRNTWSRRSVLRAAGAGVVGTLAAPLWAADARLHPSSRTRGHLKQSICRWCYQQMPLEKLAAAAAKMGYKSIELLMPEESKVVKEHGLTCAMIRCGSITEGLNRKKYHDRIEKELRAHIEFAAAEGLPIVICMSGNRRGMSDE